MVLGLNFVKKKKSKFIVSINVDNKNLYEWFGFHQSTKWALLKRMKEANLIDNISRSSGRMPGDL